MSDDNGKQALKPTSLTLADTARLLSEASSQPVSAETLPAEDFPEIV